MKTPVLQESSTFKCGKEVALGLLFSFLLIFFFYPDFVLLNKTPMHSSGWELSDPVVSFSNFKPCFRVFQKELYDHGNFLWSSLRTMGMPILGNDIQAAPLFPLTLMLSWADEDLFWNLLVVSRLILMGLGLYLLVTKFFRLQRRSAVFFIISFVYSLYVLRWMNNPWQNGLLSGIWYLYFLFEVTIQQKRYNLKRFGVFLGLVVTVYSMVTNGFPEASVMSAILVILVYVPFLLSRIFSKNLLWKSYFFDLFLAHIVGFALSSYQIFAIIELLNLSDSHRTVGLHQYPLESLIPFFAESLTQFSSNEGPLLFKDSRTYFGLIPLTFFCIGLCKTILRPLKNGFGEIGALLCGVFMVIKLFAMGPEWINRAIANHPILIESYFFVYFFSIFIWFFAYFAAKGFQTVFKLSFTNPTKIKRWQLLMIILPVCVLLLVGFAAPIVTQKQIWLLITEGSTLPQVLGLFCLAILLTHLYLHYGHKKNTATIISLCVLLLVAFEHFATLPKQFSGLHKTNYQQLDNILQRLEKQNIPLAESRIINRDGDYVSKGLATIDTGATPLLPVRTKTFRNSFFSAGVGGHLSINRAKNDYSWGLSSTNIHSFDRYYGGGKDSFPNWQNLELHESDHMYLDSVKVNNKAVDKNSLNSVTSSLDTHLFLSGWGIGTRERSPGYTTTFLIFKNDEEEIVVPTKKQIRPDVANHLGDSHFIRAGYATYVSTALFKPTSYEIILRIVDPELQHYYEQTFPHKIHFKQVEPVNQKALEKYENYLGILKGSYIYLDDSALPRAYIGSTCNSFSSIQEVKGKFQTTNFTLGNVYMEEVPSEQEQFCTNYTGEVERVKILYDHGNKVLLDEVEGPAIVVLNDNIYPGWKAKDTLQNNPLHIHPTNITFRGLLLPEKRSYKILFEYQPKWLWFAHGLAFTALLILIYLIKLSVTGRRSQESY